MPWIFFLFVGVFDFGYCSYALISVQNAARVAVLNTAQTSGSAGDGAAACGFVRQELGTMPNAAAFSSDCSALPLIVSAAQVAGVSSADGSPASQVSVTYQTIPLIPIPGLLTGQLTFTRTVQVRVRDG